MTDPFRPLGARRLAAWISTELETCGSIFGIPSQLFVTPSEADRWPIELHRRRLDTPIGVAAGPHTQLAQNIVVAWLCGARTIELKTVQTLDDITVAKPCIDMNDEGYNTEWSQELNTDSSFAEYLTAWVLIHLLHHRLGWPGDGPGVAFDISVGYDLDGLRRPNMERFVSLMIDAGDHLHRILDEFAPWFPEIADVEVPSRITDSVTLSTLHGCRPEEIGAIVEHLLTAWRLHTAVKLNPTLLGYETVRAILVDELGWTQIEPDRAAFDADLGYDDGLALLERLRRTAAGRGLDFGVKVCNTLPVANRRPDLTAGGPVAYLSGRPLHAIAVTLARRLSDDTAGRLPISFAGGADAFNTPDLLAAGLRPVTACSDLLRLGGYLRLRQYLDEIDAALDAAGAADLDELARRRAGGGRTTAEATRVNLARYAERLSTDPEVASETYHRGSTTTGRGLGLFDCVAAPCTEVCSVGQQVPTYMRGVAAGDLQRAADVIARDNPLPSILGRACHHPCEPVCTRTHLDTPLAIRDIKRFVTERARRDRSAGRALDETATVAIVGAGPCGLATAVELARAGVRATIFEARARSGGMVSATIPGYRAAPDAVERDLDAIAALGITIEHGVEIGRDLALNELADRGYRAVVLAAGARLGRRLGMAGEDAANVVDGLELLTSVGRGERPVVGPRVAVVGGGDVAIDCARTARRLGGSSVEIVYRRTIDQMPARAEELRELIGENVAIRELVAPRRIVTDRGRLAGLECAVMQLGPPDASGRPRPIEVAGETVYIELDTLIVAVGQQADLSLIRDLGLAVAPSGYLDVDPDTLETSIAGIYAGGDLRHPGPASIVDACGDGQRIARAILERANRSVPQRARMATAPPDRRDLLARRSHRLARVATPRRPAGDGDRFDEVNLTLDADAARTEAGRCLDCDLMCASCESVCPNRAIVSYVASPVTLDPGPDEPVFEVGQAPQVAVLADLCNECGNCATFCPTVGRPWRDKPRLYLDRPDFEAESENAFMLLEVGGRPAIQGRFDGVTLQLTAAPEIELRSSTSGMRLDPDTLEILGAAGSPPCRYAAAVMWTLLRGITGSLPHFPLVDAQPEWLLN